MPHVALHGKNTWQALHGPKRCHEVFKYQNDCYYCLAKRKCLLLTIHKPVHSHLRTLRRLAAVATCTTYSSSHENLMPVIECRSCVKTGVREDDVFRSNRDEKDAKTRTLQQARCIYLHFEQQYQRWTTCGTVCFLPCRSSVCSLSLTFVILVHNPSAHLDTRSYGKSPSEMMTTNLTCDSLDCYV